MSTFIVTVRLPDRTLPSYVAIGTDSCAVHIAALEHYGVCSVSVNPC